MSEPLRPAAPRLSVGLVLSISTTVLGLITTTIGVVRLMGSDGSAIAEVGPSASPSISVPASESPGEPPGSPVAAGPVTCSNDVYGWTLEFPRDWYTAGADVEQDCRYFDERPLDLVALRRAARAGKLAETGIRIYPFGGGASYSRAVEEIHNNPDLRITETIDSQATQVPAERIMATVHPASGGPKRLFLYLFSLRGKAFVADAYEPYSDDFAATIDVLDGIMASLTPV